MLIDYKDGIHAFDAHFDRDGTISLYMIIDEGRIAFVDTANCDSLPHAQNALREAGARAEDVDFILITHVHLDHAGGAGDYARAFPNARIVVHPRGARHMIDPLKLRDAVTDVYGAAEAARLYGESLIPIPTSRVLTPGDGTEITLANRRIACLHTPGHAYHHMAYHDMSANVVFTGDSFGASGVIGATFEGAAPGSPQPIFPTTSPTQFDPQEMHASIDRIVALAPRCVCLTHFGRVYDVVCAASDLHRQIDAHVRIVEEAKGDFDLTFKGLEDLLENERTINGWKLTAPEAHAAFYNDLRLNPAGLCYWFTKKNNNGQYRKNSA